MSFITVDRRAEIPLTRQIYERIRDLILSGALAAASRMLSTRELAAELRVSRNIVMDAFDQLLAEGYVQTRVGAGTYVATGARFSPRALPEISLASRVGYRPFHTDLVDFRSGLPDLHRFPVSTWQRLSRAVWDDITPLDLSYSQPEGRAELRTEIARYIGTYRGVRCHPDQILVTGGTTQAVGIVSRLLLRSGASTCVLEDPVTLDILANQVRFRFANVELVSKVVDGKFPDFNRVIPVGHTKLVELDRLTALAALQRAAILSNEKFRGVRVVLATDLLKIVCTNSEQEEAEEELEIDYKGDPLDIGFNITYLLDALQNVSVDKVRFAFGDANSSALVTMPDRDDYKYVVMPMRI